MKRILGAIVVILSINVFTATQAEANSIGIRVSPINLLIGSVDASLDIALSNFVLTPEVTIWNLELGTSESKMQALGVALSYHFSGALVDSWYLGGFGKTVAVETTNSNETGKLDTTYVGGRAGYLWVWNTFYMNLGATFGSLADSELAIRNTNTGATRTETVSTAGLGVGLEFKLGFSF